MRLVVDASPILFGSNCVLKPFRIAIAFGDRAFDPRDVNQCRAGRPPTSIGFMRRNPLFDVLSIGRRGRWPGFPQPDSTNGRNGSRGRPR
jgi:hypothetical protein